MTVTALSFSAAGPCAQATQAQAHRGLGRAMGRGAVGRGSGLPCGQRAACRSPGSASSLGVAVVSPGSSQPRLRGSALRGGLNHAHAQASGLAPAHKGVRSRASSPSVSQPRFAGLFAGQGSAAHARTPLCAGALQRYRAARCPHGSPSLARPTAPLPMALPLWGRALAWPVRTVGGRDGGCARHRAHGGRHGSPCPRQRETARRPSPESSYAVVLVLVATSPRGSPR